MIDICTEHLLSFDEAAKCLPLRYGIKSCHRNTVERWAREGLRGVRLESLLAGGRRYTSLESLQRFFDELTRVADEVVKQELSQFRATQIKVAEEDGQPLKAAGA